MILRNESISNRTELQQWASLFSGKCHAMIVVYADETGTGDVPKSGKEPSPGVYGFLATPDNWEIFRQQWKAMLAKHKACFFHFREATPAGRKDPKSHYYGWSDDQADNLIYDMAYVASLGPIPFGGGVAQKRFNSKKEAYESAFDAFFGDFADRMDNHFPNEKEQVSFFFDKNGSKEWISILDSQIEIAWQRDNRIAKEYTPIDDKTDRGMPCQAADLFAFVNRQNLESCYSVDRYLNQRILDIIVGRKGFVGMHPFSPLSTMPDEKWYVLIQDMRKRKKEFDLARRKLGLKPKQYYPVREHPDIMQMHAAWRGMHGI